MEAAITGLEAAVVLIAFVVVAAVFSHVVIASGFSLSENARDEVYRGISQAGSALQVAGTIYVVDTNNDLKRAELIRIPIQLTPGSQQINLRSMTIRFTGLNQLAELTPNKTLFASSPPAGRFSITHPIRPDQNSLLNPGEVVVLVFSPTSTKDTSPGSTPTVEIFAPGVLPLHIRLVIPASLTRYTPVR